FVAIVEKALRKDPAQRYQRLADMAGDLRAFRQATEIDLLPVRQRSTARRAWVVAGLAGVAVAALVVAGAARGGLPGPAGPGGAAGAAGAPGVAGVAAAPAGSGPAAKSGAGTEAQPSTPLIAVMGFETPDDPGDSERLGAMLARLLTTHLSSTAG